MSMTSSAFVTSHDWIDTSSVGDYSFEPLEMQDTTSFAWEANQHFRRRLADQYLSQKVQVFKLESGERQPKSHLAVHGVRFLYQDDMAGTTYGTTHVSIALPDSFIDQLVERFSEADGQVEIARDAVKDAHSEEFDGVRYTISTANLKRASSYVNVNDQPFPCSLAAALRSERKDIFASVAFALCLKYKGRELDEGETPPMKIAFEPHTICLTAIANEALLSEASDYDY